MLDENDKRIVRDMVEAGMLKVAEYQTRKRGDTPTDALQLTPQKYVNLNGSVAGRPIGSVATRGQFYLSTDIPTPMWYTGTNWVNGVGSVVASN